MLKDIWIIMLLLGFLGIILSLMLFFIWRVPELIDDLSGNKAKRQIKLMRDINSNSGSLERFSTNEVYMGFSNGSLLSEDSVNIKVDQEYSDIIPEKIESIKHNDNMVDDETGTVDEDDVVTSDLSKVENKTEFLYDEEESTSYVDESDVVTIKILEELSSV